MKYVRKLVLLVIVVSNTCIVFGESTNTKALQKLAKDKDKAVACTATAQLAAYYRREGDLKKAEKVLSKFSSPSGFDRLPAKVAIPYLRCLLENAHIKALKKDLPGSLQLLNWAEGRKRDYERAFSCMKYAEILLDLNETERAQAYLKNVKQILAKHINESATGGAIGQGSKALDTQGSWRTLRDQANHLALEIEEVQLSKKFGATYASYVKLRRLQRIVKRSKSPRYFSEAIKLCDEIEESDPESQFAAAAGYLKAQLLLKNPTEDPKKAIKEAKNQLNKFIKSNPEGLYRGEALMLLGKISLEKEWDAKDAEKYYSQALTWFKQAREKRDAMSLYAPMSNDLKTQTKATQKPTSLNKWKRTVYHKEDPLRLYNTASAPSWYISGKEKNCIFALGFLTFSNGKYDEAKRYWEQLPALDDTVGTANSNYPSLMIRLMSACRFKLLIFSEAELVDVKNINERLRINYASLLFMLERFADSEAMFDKIFKTSKNLYVKALCMINKGNIADCKADGKKVAFKCYKWVLEKKKLKKSIIYGTALINYANALCGTSKGYILSVPFYEEYIKRFKKIGRYDYYRKASYRIVSCLIKQKKYSKAKQLFSKFKKEKNDVYVKVLEYKFKRANQGVNL